MYDTSYALFANNRHTKLKKKILRTTRGIKHEGERMEGRDGGGGKELIKKQKGREGAGRGRAVQTVV